MLFLRPCVGYRQNMRGLLKCKCQRIKKRDTSLAMWALSRAIFEKSTPIQKQGHQGEIRGQGLMWFVKRRVTPRMGYSLEAFGRGKLSETAKEKPNSQDRPRQIIYFFHFCLRGQLYGGFLLE